MPKRIATQTVILYREGKRLRILPAQSFDFSKEEMDEIKRTAPDALRQPINESDTLKEVIPPNMQSNDVGGIQNLDNTAANPAASTPAPTGKATSPVTNAKSNPKPAAKDDDL